jgi:hypothetical protein
MARCARKYWGGEGHGIIIGLTLPDEQDFGCTPKRRPDYQESIWSGLTDLLFWAADRNQQ